MFTGKRVRHAIVLRVHATVGERGAAIVSEAAHLIIYSIAYELFLRYTTLTQKTDRAEKGKVANPMGNAMA